MTRISTISSRTRFGFRVHVIYRYKLVVEYLFFCYQNCFAGKKPIHLLSALNKLWPVKNCVGCRGEFMDGKLPLVTYQFVGFKENLGIADPNKVHKLEMF